MNANELLDLIGSARDQYVMEALATKNRRAVRRKPGRVLLVAAMIAMMLVLVGCAAVYVLHLQDMKAGERPYSREFNDRGQRVDPTEVTMELYTPHALKDTPIQKATVEWNDYLSQYDPDHPQLGEEDILEKYKYVIPPNYTNTYGCDTPEMAMKLDEIVAKYNLKLLGEELLAQRWQRDTMNHLLGINGVTRADAQAKVQEGAGLFYPNGNFSGDLSFTLWNEDVAWTKECYAQFHYARKDTFDPQLSTTFAGKYEQWNYTSADGTDLLLVLEDSGKGQIYADVGDATIFIALDAWLYDRDAEKPTREAIQQMADIFDYHLKPQPFDLGEAYAKLKAVDEEYQSRLSSTECRSYAEFLNKMDWLGRYSYLLMDLNGDGVEELILDNSGAICEFYTIENGEVARRGGMFAPYIFCEGGVVVSDTENENLGGKYNTWSASQYTGTGHTSFKSIEAVYHFENGTWEHKVGDDYEGTMISEEEAMAIIEKYTPLDISFTPVTDFPMDAQGTTLGQIMAADPRPTAEEVLQKYVAFAASDDSRLRNARYFALRDMNGDGIDDLLLGSEPNSIDDIITIYRGRVTELRRLYRASLCEGNVLDRGERYDHEELGRVQEHHFIRLYNEHRSKDLGKIHHYLDSDTWSDEEGNPISTEEAQALLAKYPRTDPGMKPISELGK